MVRVIGIWSGLLFAAVLAAGCSDEKRSCSADTDCPDGAYCRESDGTCVGCTIGVDHPYDDKCVADSVDACGPMVKPCGAAPKNGSMACTAGECIYSCGDGWTKCESGCCADCEVDLDCPENAYCVESGGYCVGCTAGVQHPENDTCVEDRPTACGPDAKSCGAAPKHGEAYCNQGMCDYRCLGAHEKCVGGCCTIECTVDVQCAPSGLICNEKWGVCAVPNCDGQNDFTPCEVSAALDLSYDICVGEVCVSPGTCGEMSCNTPGPNFPLADTGQITCYDDTYDWASGDYGVIQCPMFEDPLLDFYGQDAQYGWDKTHEDGASRFGVAEIEGDRVITDKVTGLEWVGCVQGLTESGCGDDSNVCEGTEGRCTWEQALDYCDSLDWGGEDDWRLPDPYELLSIIDVGRYGPAIDNSVFTDMPDAAFEDTVTWVSTFLWSSSSDVVSSEYALVVNFGYGHTFKRGKGSAEPVRWEYVRCVRAGP